MRIGPNAYGLEMVETSPGRYSIYFQDRAVEYNLSFSSAVSTYNRILRTIKSKQGYVGEDDELQYLSALRSSGSGSRYNPGYGYDYNTLISKLGKQMKPKIPFLPYEESHVSRRVVPD